MDQYWFVNYRLGMSEFVIFHWRTLQETCGTKENTISYSSKERQAVEKGEHNLMLKSLSFILSLYTFFKPKSKPQDKVSFSFPHLTFKYNVWCGDRSLVYGIILTRVVCTTFSLLYCLHKLCKICFNNHFII